MFDIYDTFHAEQCQSNVQYKVHSTIEPVYQYKCSGLPHKSYNLIPDTPVLVLYFVQRTAMRLKTCSTVHATVLVFSPLPNKVVWSYDP
jgi:hypothetical protein